MWFEKVRKVGAMKKSWVLMMAVGVVWSAGGWAEAAVDCSTVPSCASLGYTNTESDCYGAKMVRCPFDRTAVFCRDLPGTVKTCVLGDILYSDLQCYSAPPTNVEPIAMVLDPEARLAVGFEEKELGWLGSGDAKAVSGDESSNTDGKALTKMIVEKIGAGTSYAAGYCYYGYRTDVSPTGTWFLPSIRQHQMLYNNKSVYNSVAASVGEKPLSSARYWSSNFRRASYSLLYRYYFRYDNDGSLSDYEFSNAVHNTKCMMNY